MSSLHKSHRATSRSSAPRKKVLAAASNVTQFKRSAVVRRSPRRPEQQKRNKTIQFRVTDEVFANSRRAAKFTGQTQSNMWFKIAATIDFDGAMGGDGFFAIVVAKDVHVVRFDPGWSKDQRHDAFDHLVLVKSPTTEIADRLQERLLKIFKPDAARDFWLRGHPDLGGLSPCAASHKGRHHDVARLIRRYEREARSST